MRQRNLVVKPETKLQCYKTFIRPIAEYSSSVWDLVGNNQLTKQIGSVQKKLPDALQITGIMTSALDKSQKSCTCKAFQNNAN